MGCAWAWDAAASGGGTAGKRGKHHSRDDELHLDGRGGGAAVATDDADAYASANVQRMGGAGCAAPQMHDVPRGSTRRSGESFGLPGSDLSRPAAFRQAVTAGTEAEPRIRGSEAARRFKQTHFEIQAGGTMASFVAFFTEHLLTELERDAHYVENIAGNDVEPITSLPGAVPDHDLEVHDHGNEMPFEWTGILSTPEGSYLLTMQTVDGTYADPGRKVVLSAVTASREAELHTMGSEAEHRSEQACI